MGNTIQTIAAAALITFTLMISGCDGCGSFKGPGIPYSTDGGEVHYLKIGAGALYLPGSAQ